MIKINDIFSCYYDGRCWVLHEARKGVAKRGENKGKEIDVVDITYPSSFVGVCNSVIDRTIGGCDKLENIIDIINETKEELKKAIEDSGINYGGNNADCK